MDAINIICRYDVEVSDCSLPCVAVDAGLTYALENDCPVVVAIGDFDSVDEESVKEYNGEIITLDCAKDDSDLAVALKYLENFSGDIYVYGALGKRFDHSLANIYTLFNSDKDIYFYDQYNEIYCLASGKHTVAKNNYKYISFFTLSEAKITLKGFKYPLTDYVLKNNDTLTLSNEILKSEGEVIVEGGKIIIIKSQD